MEPINGCVCLKLDFTEDSAVNTINLMLRGRTTNVVLRYGNLFTLTRLINIFMISDMAPSYSGQKDIDHERLMVRIRILKFGNFSFSLHRSENLTKNG